LLAVLLLALALARLRWGGMAGFGSAFASPSGARTAEKIGSRYRGLPAGVLIAGIVIYTFVSNEPSGLKLYPALISFSLLASFAWSLLHPPTAIERIARLATPDLPPAGVAYTRKVTLLWCGFFLFNGLVALYTSLYTGIATWTLYNGLISYLLIGSLLGGELLWRRKFHAQPQERTPC
jgi:uncharacterized membrane protein